MTGIGLDLDAAPQRRWGRRWSLQLERRRSQIAALLAVAAAVAVGGCVIEDK